MKQDFQKRSRFRLRIEGMAISIAHGSLDAPSARGLADAIEAGDEAAAEALVRAYWLDAFRVALYLTQDQGVAEDVAQESLLAAVRSISGFDRARPLRPWIERIAVNRSHDWLRRRRSRPELVVEMPPTNDPNADELADELAQGALPDELVGALGELDEDRRTAVVLRHLLDYRPSEIAAIVGASEGAVRSRIHRGLLQLRATLSDSRKEEHDERSR